MPYDARYPGLCCLTSVNESSEPQKAFGFLKRYAVLPPGQFPSDAPNHVITGLDRGPCALPRHDLSRTRRAG